MSALTSSSHTFLYLAIIAIATLSESISWIVTHIWCFHHHSRHFCRSDGCDHVSMIITFKASLRRGREDTLGVVDHDRALPEGTSKLVRLH
jgi:hypothetical protein